MAQVGPNLIANKGIVVRQHVQTLCCEQEMVLRPRRGLGTAYAPADVTVVRGKWLRDERKAIKNGTSVRLFTALRALFDVSLHFFF
jgi:hypothetical protein